MPKPPPPRPTADPAQWTRESTVSSVRVPVQLLARLDEITKSTGIRKGDLITCGLSRLLQLYDEDRSAFSAAVSEFAAARAAGASMGTPRPDDAETSAGG